MHACGIQYFAWDLRKLFTGCLVFLGFFCFPFRVTQAAILNPSNLTKGSCFLCPPVPCSLSTSGCLIYCQVLLCVGGWSGRILLCFLPPCWLNSQQVNECSLPTWDGHREPSFYSTLLLSFSFKGQTVFFNDVNRWGKKNGYHFSTKAVDQIIVGVCVCVCIDL